MDLDQRLFKELVLSVLRLERKIDRLSRLSELERVALMSVGDELARLQTEVAEQTDVIASGVNLLGRLAQLIRDNAADPVALAALADQVDANSNALAAAITENTPVA